MEVPTKIANTSKDIFEDGIKKLILESVRQGRVVQTQDTNDLEEYVVFDAAGQEVAKVRENYKNGRSTVLYKGKAFSKIDRHYIDGSVNHRLTDAESSSNLNTINEKDFAELYRVIAAKAISR